MSRRTWLQASTAALALGGAAWSAPGAVRAQAVAPPKAAAGCAPLLARSFPRLQDEKPVSLCEYAGRVLLVVNTASFCGFTPQFKALEDLNQRFSAQGLTVLGFPSNDFNQEAGSAKEIAAVCEGSFGVKFPMFAVSRVSASAGADRNPLFADLARISGTSPRWNFHKYLVGRDARTVQAFGSLTDPGSERFVEAVRRALAAT